MKKFQAKFFQAKQMNALCSGAQFAAFPYTEDGVLILEMLLVDFFSEEIMSFIMKYVFSNIQRNNKITKLASISHQSRVYFINFQMSIFIVYVIYCAPRKNALSEGN